MLHVFYVVARQEHMKFALEVSCLSRLTKSKKAVTLINIQTSKSNSVYYRTKLRLFIYLFIHIFELCNGIYIYIYIYIYI